MPSGRKALDNLLTLDPWKRDYKGSENRLEKKVKLTITKNGPSPQNIVAVIADHRKSPGHCSHIQDS